MTDRAGAPALHERTNMKVNDSVLHNGCAAIVTAINADGSVNLRVFHPDGTDSAPAGVMLAVVDAPAVEPAPSADTEPTVAADAAA